MNIDFEAIRAGRTTYADQVRTVQYTDLYTITDEFFSTIESILTGATDATVTFVPHDSAASDNSEQGWPLSHIIAHLTASLEESAASAAMLARGVEAKERVRLRYETPWEKLSTIALVRSRLRESQRMCHAFLDAWPDEAHLDIVVTPIPFFGPINAVGLYLIGIGHGQGHLEQLRETMRQYTTSSNA